MNDITHEILFIESLLDEAVECNLLSEVVFFALKAMKEQPTLTESEAIILGYNEWIK